MAEIARTNGATSGIATEIRQGTLADVASADVANWRAVTEQAQAVDGRVQIRTTPNYNIQSDGSVLKSYSMSYLPVELRRENLKQLAAQERWKRMQAGVVVGGVRVQTSDDAVPRITGALDALKDGVMASVEFKANSGWMTADLATMTVVRNAVVGHLQACYSAERAVCDAIDTDTITTSAQVTAYAWP